MRLQSRYARFGLLFALLLTGGGLAGLMQPALISGGQVRLASVGGTAGTDYAITIGNRYSTANLATFNRQLFELTNGDPTNRLARFRYTFAISAASTTVPYRVWLVEKGSGSTADYEFQLLGTGSCTSRASGTGVAAGSVITSSEYPCDVISFTPADGNTSPKGIYAALALSYRTSYVAYSPGSLVPGQVFISDAGNFRYVVFDFDPAAGVIITPIVTPGT